MNCAQAIKLIHVARRDLAIDDDAWRDLLRRKFRVESSKDLGIVDLYRLIEHLKKFGFKIRHKAAQRAPSRPLADDPQSKKIRALWLSLHQTGAVRNSSEAALAAYVKRITGVDALQWLSSEQASRVIETLKQWVCRIAKEGRT
jgi:phage gp16-like protein